MSAATFAGVPSLADWRESGKVADDFGKQGCISAGQNGAVALQREEIALPVRDAATCTFHNRHKGTPVPGFHGAFRNDVDLAEGEQSVGIAISAP